MKIKEKLKEFGPALSNTNKASNFHSAAICSLNFHSSKISNVTQVYEKTEIVLHDNNTDADDCLNKWLDKMYLLDINGYSIKSLSHLSVAATGRMTCYLS